jgi:hypothetical protein
MQMEQYKKENESGTITAWKGGLGTDVTTIRLKKDTVENEKKAIEYVLRIPIILACNKIPSISIVRQKY